MRIFYPQRLSNAGQDPDGGAMSAVRAVRARGIEQRMKINQLLPVTDQ